MPHTLAHACNEFPQSLIKVPIAPKPRVHLLLCGYQKIIWVTWDSCFFNTGQSGKEFILIAVSVYMWSNWSQLLKTTSRAILNAHDMQLQRATLHSALHSPHFLPLCVFPPSLNSSNSLGCCCRSINWALIWEGLRVHLLLIMQVSRLE